MSKLNHTDGPYKVVEREDGRREIQTLTGGIIAIMAGVPRPWVHDDAVLLAAAPEMLELLTTINNSWLEEFPDGPDTISVEYMSIASEHRDIWNKITSIIEKATGNIP